MGRVYTRGGDGGQTSLGDGSRVSKDSRRIAVSGVIDETFATLGLARSFAPEQLNEPIKKIQYELINLMGRISMAAPDAPLPEAEELEGRLEEIRKDVPMPDFFVIPGDSKCGAALHMARTVIRRAERELAALKEEEGYADERVFKYVNRLSDVLFAMALQADREAKIVRITQSVMKAFKKEKGENEMTVLLKDAKVLLEAMEKKATEIKVPMAMAVSDGDGKLVAFTRQENVLPVSIEIARKKAYTAIQLKMPSDNLAALSRPGDMLYGLQHGDPNLIVFGGGIPLLKDGAVIGAVGVSGGSVPEDIAVAEAGIAAWKAIYK